MNLADLKEYSLKTDLGRRFAYHRKPWRIDSHSKVSRRNKGTWYWENQKPSGRLIVIALPVSTSSWVACTYSVFKSLHISKIINDYIFLCMRKKTEIQRGWKYSWSHTVSMLKLQPSLSWRWNVCRRNSDCDPRWKTEKVEKAIGATACRQGSGS